MRGDEAIHIAHCEFGMCKYGDRDCPVVNDIKQVQINASARAASAANEFAASIRALQMASLNLNEISAVVGLDKSVVGEIMLEWGLDT